MIKMSSCVRTTIEVQQIMCIIRNSILRMCMIITMHTFHFDRSTSRNSLEMQRNITRTHTIFSIKSGMWLIWRWFMIDVRSFTFLLFSLFFSVVVVWFALLFEFSFRVRCSQAHEWFEYLFEWDSEREINCKKPLKYHTQKPDRRTQQEHFEKKEESRRWRRKKNCICKINNRNVNTVWLTTVRERERESRRLGSNGWLAREIYRKLFLSVCQQTQARTLKPHSLNRSLSRLFAHLAVFSSIQRFDSMGPNGSLTWYA